MSRTHRVEFAGKFVYWLTIELCFLAEALSVAFSVFLKGGVTSAVLTKMFGSWDTPLSVGPLANCDIQNMDRNVLSFCYHRCKWRTEFSYRNIAACATKITVLKPKNKLLISNWHLPDMYILSENVAQRAVTKLTSDRVEQFKLLGVTVSRWSGTTMSTMFAPDLINGYITSSRSLSEASCQPVIYYVSTSR